MGVDIVNSSWRASNEGWRSTCTDGFAIAWLGATSRGEPSRRPDGRCRVGHWPWRRAVLGRVSLLVGLGVTLGAGVSFGASTLVASLLYGVEPRDPMILIGAVLTLAAVGVLAGGVPAYRASRIDPAEVLTES